MSEILLSDECWVALALLQRENPERESFKPTEIRKRIAREKLHSELRAGIPAHLSQHLVANKEPVSGRYRMLYRKGDGTLRLFRPGDDFHPERKGKTRPDPDELPPRYRDLVRWYEEEYSHSSRSVDPVLAMRGFGKEIWSTVDSDKYVDELRSGWTSQSSSEA
jgi:hypothetical protein